MARRFRKRRGTWFPNVGTAGPGEGADVDDDDAGLWFRFVLPAVAGSGSFLTQTLILPLTFDQIEEDNLNVNERLANIVGSEYILRRIVGNLFVGREAGIDTAAGDYSGVLVSAGFMVARQEDESISPDIPIGANGVVESRENYSPAATSTIREPWIWRRRWILGRGSAGGFTAQPNFQGPTFAFPPSNVSYNGSNSNQYIDARTIRRVGQDDRLWLSMAVRGLSDQWLAPFTADRSVQETDVHCHLDYRLFGSLRRAKQTGRF